MTDWLSEFGEEARDVLGEELWFLGRREVPTARHRRPPPQVVEPLDPFTRGLTFGYKVLGEQSHRRGNAHVVEGPQRFEVPAVVVVIAHRGCDAAGDPVDG